MSRFLVVLIGVTVSLGQAFGLDFGGVPVEVMDGPSGYDFQLHPDPASWQPCGDDTFFIVGLYCVCRTGENAGKWVKIDDSPACAEYQAEKIGVRFQDFEKWKNLLLTGPVEVPLNGWRVDTNDACAVVLAGETNVVQAEVISVLGITNDFVSFVKQGMSEYIDRVEKTRANLPAMVEWAISGVEGEEWGLKYFDAIAGGSPSGSLGFVSGLQDEGASWGSKLAQGRSGVGAASSGADLSWLFGRQDFDSGSGSPFQSAAADFTIAKISESALTVQSWSETLRKALRALAALTGALMIASAGIISVKWLWELRFVSEPTGQAAVGGNANSIVQQVNVSLLFTICFVVGFVAASALGVYTALVVSGGDWYSPWRLAEGMTYHGGAQGNQFFDVLDRYFDFGVCLRYLQAGVIHSVSVFVAAVGGRIAYEYLRR